MNTPKIAGILLRLLIQREDKSPLSGDMEEVYHDLQHRNGKFQAWIWFWGQVLVSLRTVIWYSALRSISMFRNYLKIAFRNARKQGLFTAINVSGLSAGLACCILILLWLQDEIGYDRFHKNFKNIYRVIQENRSSNESITMSTAPFASVPSFHEDFHEILYSTRFRGGFSNWRINYGEKTFYNDNLCVADPEFFKIFSFDFIKGNGEGALKSKNSIVITAETAEKYFGNDDPLGKILLIGDDEQPMEISGVLENIPARSHLQFDIIFNIANAADWWRADLASWKDSRTSVYILTDENADPSGLDKKIENFVKDHDPQTYYYLSLQPLSDIHLRSVLTWDFDNYMKGNIRYIYLFSTIAIGVLLIAGINFMNLSTARSAKRAKEVGMRKVHGAYKIDLVKQFFVESSLLSVISLILSFFLVFTALPVFNGLSGKTLNFSAIAEPGILISLLSLMVITGLISGIYPSLYLSSFQPVNVLKGITPGNIRFGANLRKTLVVLQFGLSIILIFATGVIYSQLNFVINKPLGFDKKNILSLDSIGGFRNDPETVKQELLNVPGVRKVSWSIIPNGYIEPTTDISWEGKDPEEKVIMYRCIGDYDYLETFGLKMAEGRFFSKDILSERTNYILNESAVKAIGMKSPVGKPFTFRDSEGIIIGVVKDFHQGSLHSKIKPILMTYSERFFSVHIKISRENSSVILENIEEIWEKFVPGRPFKYRFIEDIVDGFYRSEEKTGNIIKYFTFLTLILSCLGLFGLASFSAEQRIREVGIRKSLGATDISIIKLLTTDFVKWIGIAVIFSCPPAVYIMGRWLNNFAYRTDVGLTMIIFTILSVLFIAILTVSFQSFRTARSKPVDSLKYE